MFGVSWCIESKIYLVLGVMDTTQNPKIMKSMGFRVFPKWNRPGFRPVLFPEFTIKMVPQTPPHRPQFAFSLISFKEVGIVSVPITMDADFSVSFNCKLNRILQNWPCFVSDLLMHQGIVFTLSPLFKSGLSGFYKGV